MLRSLDYHTLAQFRIKDKNYTLHEIQKEIMSQEVLREKAQNIQSSVIYTIMEDEIKISNKEKNGTVFCIRWFDDNLQPRKE